MQTFLPYPSFRQSLECLDRKRLGKQRIEARQILYTIIGVSTAWTNHPAVEMWRGYEQALIWYYNMSLTVWEERGYRNVKLSPIRERSDVFKTSLPWWWNWDSFHDAHKSNLLRKDKEFYSQYGWNVSDNLPYVWPNTFRSVLIERLNDHCLLDMYLLEERNRNESYVP